MIKGIIFDKDGTMFDSERYYFEGWEIFSKKLGKPLSFQQIQQLESLSSIQQASLAKHFLGDIDPYAFKKQISQYVWDKQHESLPFKKGLIELLEYGKKKGIQMGIASSGRLSLIEDNLKMTNLEDYFSALVSGHDVKRGKPYPDVYLETAKKLQCDPRECLVIEDSPNGIEGAKAAGCKTIFIQDLFLLNPMTEQVSDYVCSDLEEVIDILKQEALK